MSYQQHIIKYQLQSQTSVRHFLYRLLFGLVFCVCFNAYSYALPSATTTPLSHTTPNSSQLNIVQQQLLDTQHQSHEYFNQLESQVQTLQEQSTALRDQLVSLQHQLHGVAQQLTAQLQAQTKPSLAQQWFTGLSAWVMQLQYMLGAVGFKLLMGLLCIFVLWLLWCLRPKKTKRTQLSVPQPSPPVDSIQTMSKTAAQVAALQPQSQGEGGEGEYDFLSSRDAIPTKLDLARAYIAMKNHSAARLVLQEVIMQGNSIQQQTAKAMWAELEAEAS